MKKNRLYSLLTAFIICILSVSCVNETADVDITPVKKTFTVKGNVSLESSRGAVPSQFVTSVKGKTGARTAISSFSLQENETFELIAINLDDAAIKTVLGEVFTESGIFSYEISIPLGNWLLQAGLKKYFESSASGLLDSEWVLFGSTSVVITESSPETINTDITVSPVKNDDIPGNINLKFIDATEGYGIKSITCTFKDNVIPLERINVTADNGEKSAVLSLSDIPAGAYEVDFCFLGRGQVYSCTEILNVFSGFTTDTWYGNSPYLVTENGRTEFILDSSVLEGYKYVTGYTNPHILWSFTDDNEGGTINTDVAFFDGGIYDGSIANSGIAVPDFSYPEFYGDPVFDFTIDAKTQKFYLYNNDKIYEYPTYYDSSKAAEVAPAVGKFACYDGKLWAIINDSEGSPFTVKRIDVNEPDSEYEDYSIEGIDADDFPGSGLIEYKSCIAVNAENLFAGIVKNTKNSQVLSGPEILLYQFAIDNENKKLVMADYCETNALAILETTDLSSEFAISDMQLMDGDDGTEIYVLIRDATLHRYDENFQRGALLKYTVENGGKITPSTIGGEYAYGWNSEYENSASEWCSSGESNYDVWEKFFIPRKFIAIKPKKLVIADEGFCSVGVTKYYDEDYNVVLEPVENGYSDIEYVDESYNRIITIDLQDASQTITEVDAELFGCLNSNYEDHEKQY